MEPPSIAVHINENVYTEPVELLHSYRDHLRSIPSIQSLIIVEIGEYQFFLETVNQHTLSKM